MALKGLHYLRLECRYHSAKLLSFKSYSICRHVGLGTLSQFMQRSLVTKRRMSTTVVAVKNLSSTTMTTERTTHTQCSFNENPTGAILQCKIIVE